MEFYLALISKAERRMCVCLWTGRVWSKPEKKNAEAIRSPPLQDPSCLGPEILCHCYGCRKKAGSHSDTERNLLYECCDLYKEPLKEPVSFPGHIHQYPRPASLQPVSV